MIRFKYLYLLIIKYILTFRAPSKIGADYILKLKNIFHRKLNSTFNVNQHDSREKSSVDFSEKYTMENKMSFSAVVIGALSVKSI